MIFLSSAIDTAPNFQGWLPAIVGLVLALGGLGGLATFVKSRPEGSKILIDAATGVVVVQTGVITDLRNQLDETRFELDKAKTQIDELRGHVAEMSLLRRENDRLNERVSILENENSRLRSRVAELERNTS